MYYPLTSGYASKITEGRMFSERNEAIEHDLDAALKEIHVRGFELSTASSSYRAMKFLVEYIEHNEVFQKTPAEAAE